MCSSSCWPFFVRFCEHVAIDLLNGRAFQDSFCFNWRHDRKKAQQSSMEVLENLKRNFREYIEKLCCGVNDQELGERKKCMN